MANIHLALEKVAKRNVTVRRGDGMPPAQDAMMQRRRLKSELRRIRTKAGFRQQDVAEAMDWSLSKLIRLESSGKVATSDLRALLQHYKVVDQKEIERYVAMARASKEEGWWSKYREATSPEFLTFLGYEYSASAIYQFEPQLIPGQLQDKEYAREVLAAYGGPATSTRLEEWVELRLERQYELFERATPAEMNFVLDEAVLHRWVGGRDVMRRQLKHLKEYATRDHVTIEIVPFRAGAHPGMKGPFVILEFSEFDDVLYLENSRGSMVSRDKQDEIETYRESFDQLQKHAKGEGLEEIVDRVLKEMSG
jgi:transcriptional regulator with XRE-family HTH domain